MKNLSDLFGGEWRLVDGYENYAVSSDGRVACIKTKRPNGNKVPFIMRLHRNHDGYLRIKLHSLGTTRDCGVSKLVLAAFSGPPPNSKAEADHINCVRDDNRIENLQWVSGRENLRLRSVRGTVAKGSRQGAAKLKEKDIEFIRANYVRCGKGNAWNLKNLAKRFNVHFSTIAYVTSGKYWKHV
jgi:hypothetical protein